MAKLQRLFKRVVPEDDRSPSLAWYHKNKERSAANGRAYREKNRVRIREVARAYREANREKVLKRQADWRKANPRRRQDTRRKSRYGISADEYNRLFAEQHGKCAICEKEQDEPLAVDHDHGTDEVRGLLCRLCNMTLGSAQDSTTILRRMITYLERYHAKQLRAI